MFKHETSLLHTLFLKLTKLARSRHSRDGNPHIAQYKKLPRFLTDTQGYLLI